MIFEQLKRHVSSTGLLAILVLTLSSCASNKEAPVAVDARTADTIKSSSAPYSHALAETAERVRTGADDEDRAKVFKGSGIMVRGQAQGGAVPPVTVTPASRGGGNIVLNFEAADLREVIRNILGDILGEAYLIDPTVNGQVTIRTTAGIPRESLYATLETLLRMNNATMIKEEGVYKILPAAVGVKGSVTPQLGSSQRPLPKGYSVQIVPLRYVGAKEMMKILEPFAKDAQALRTDDLRNLIILSGTELELRHLLDTIEMFDIDWMAGMSVGIFKLKNLEVKGLSQDIQTALGSGDNPLLSGALKLIPIERMNALMVISAQPGLLDEVKKWIDWFDEEENAETPRLFVYNLKYARADRLAPLLQQAFTGKNTGPTRIQPATTAPGTRPVTMGGVSTIPGTATGARSTVPGARQTATTGAARQQAPGTAGAAPGAAARPGTVVARPGMPAMGTAAGGLGIAQDIQVVADEDNNAILIVATPSEYTLVEQALKKLDVPQRQVVIEVTMAEVTLTDGLDIGSKWWFTSGSKTPSGGTYGGYGSARPPTDIASLGGSAFNLIIDPNQLKAIITASDTASNVKVVANPHIAALDNQEATISITNQIPYKETYVGGVSESYRSDSWKYVSPGVIVRVKPHINEGGNVSLEADIEFSAVSGSAPEGAPPPLMDRKVSSQLMVPSGSTMVIGGLIRDDKTSGSEGVPLLSRIPVLGALFGSQSWSNSRTELVIFLTPRVVENEETRRAIIQDMRFRMDNLEGLLQETKALPTDLLRQMEGLDKQGEAKEAAAPAVPPSRQIPPPVVAPTPVTPPPAATPAPPAAAPPAPVPAPAATPPAPVPQRPAAAPVPAPVTPPPAAAPAVTPPTPPPAVVPAPPAATPPTPAPAPRRRPAAVPAPATPPPAAAPVPPPAVAPTPATPPPAAAPAPPAATPPTPAPAPRRPVAPAPVTPQPSASPPTATPAPPAPTPPPAAVPAPPAAAPPAAPTATLPAVPGLVERVPAMLPQRESTGSSMARVIKGQ